MTAYLQLASMVERLKTKGIQPAKCVYPNWVDTKMIRPLQISNQLREELALSPDTFVALRAAWQKSKD